MQPFFSIIIPAYNAAKTIHAAISSILNQEFRNFELLVIDGGSTDDTATIVQSFADERILFRSEKDKGVYDAMNKGIGLATGEYLYFLGCDDTLYDSKVLQTIHEICLARPSHVIYGNVVFLSSRESYAGAFTLHRLLYEQNISHQAIFYRKDCFRQLGKFNLKYKISADWEYNIRCFMHPDFIIEYVGKPIAVYNDVDGLSKDYSDVEFEKISPFYNILKLNSGFGSFKYSQEYRIGRILLSPYRIISRMFSKK
jgi:glycosyltransferase involved in cell wall biosynthesis